MARHLPKVYVNGSTASEAAGVFSITSLTPAAGEALSFAGTTDSLTGTVVWPRDQGMAPPLRHLT